MGRSVVCIDGRRGSYCAKSRMLLDLAGEEAGPKREMFRGLSAECYEDTCTAVADCEAR